MSIRQEYSVIGKRLPLVDAVEKATGAARFVDDMYLPGMVYGKILRSPHAHAKIVKIDISKAEALSGVKAVFTHKNVPRVKWSTALFPTPFSIDDTYILDDKVRYVGDEVAAVVASDEYTAEEALELIEVEYEVLPVVSDPMEALKPDAPEIHPGGNLVSEQPTVNEQGDIEMGFKEADYIFEDTYRNQVVQAIPMEPRGVLCDFDTSGNLTVYESNQEPFHLRVFLANVLRMSQSKIRVVSPFVGGGFGSKADMERKTVLASLGAKETGRSVKIIYNREEETLSRTRHATTIRWKIGVKKDGTITSMHTKAFVDTGAYVSHGPGVGWAVGYFSLGLYKCPNYKTEVYLVYTNKCTAGAFRGYGNPQASFARELMVDRICQELKIDPVEWRMKHHIQAGDEIPTMGGVTLTSCGLSECLEKGAEAIGWKKKKKPVNGTKRRGIGVGCMMHCSGIGGLFPDTSGAVIILNEDGTINLLTGVLDQGTGCKTILAQVAAEELGLRIEDVRVIAGDTAITPYDEGSYSSRTAHVASTAVKSAADDVRQQLLEFTAGLLEASMEDLEIKNNRIYVKGSPEKGFSISEIAMKAMTAVSATRSITGKGEAKGFGGVRSAPFAAQFAEVEVDTVTGRVKVLRIAAAHDVGKALNPTIVEGQIEGAVLQGVGYALTEEIIFNKDMEPTNPTFLDYKIPSSLDAPEVVPMFVEPIDPAHPYGVKGVGEPGLVPTAPAIVNAIYDAIGVQIKDLPITPEKILEALREKGE